MFLLDRRNLLKMTALGGAAAFLPTAAFGAAGVAGTELFTADEAGLLVDSAVIMGERAAVLVDTQFTAGNAALLADTIAATGRTLQSILITHYHPDHLLGLPILLDRFPGAKAYAHPEVQAFIAKVAQPMFDRIAGGAPAGVFADRVVVPEALTADHLMLEGERIEVLPPMAGDTALITPVHIPAIDTLIAADVAYVDTHLWMEEAVTPEAVAAWRASVATLRAIGAGTVIPGHRKATSPSDDGVFVATLAYLDRWEAAVASSRNAEELRTQLLSGGTDFGFAFAVERSAEAAFPKG